MKRAEQAFRIARFDIESLISTILRIGMWISLSLIVASLIVQWIEKSPVGFENKLRATSVPVLILDDLQGGSSQIPWSSLIMHLGVAALLLTPYVRVAATLLYFMRVEPSWKRCLCTGLVLLLLTVILLTNWV